FVVFICTRPVRDPDEFVIGAETTAPAALEDRPIVFRPSVDPGSPASPLGAGAAAHFAPAEPEPGPAAPEPPAEEEPDEPEQLGFALDDRGGWQLPAIEMLNAPQVSNSRKHDNAARA